MALGLLEDSEGGEGYLDNNGKVSGYRYSDEKGAEIIVDTFVQTVTVGGALIDEHGTINGMSHAGKSLKTVLISLFRSLPPSIPSVLKSADRKTRRRKYRWPSLNRCPLPLTVLPVQKNPNRWIRKDVSKKKPRPKQAGPFLALQSANLLPKL